MDPEAEVITISDESSNDAINISSDEEDAYELTAHDRWGYSDNSEVCEENHQIGNINELSSCLNDDESSSEDGYSYEVNTLKRKPGPKSKTTFDTYHKIKKIEPELDTENNKSVHELMADCKQSTVTAVLSTNNTALLAEKGQSSGEIINESLLESDSDINSLKVNTSEVPNEIYCVSSDSVYEIDESDEDEDMKEKLSKNDNIKTEINDMEESKENNSCDIPKSEQVAQAKNDDNISDVLNKNNGELSDQSKENIDFIDKTKNDNGDKKENNDAVQNEIKAGDLIQNNCLSTENHSIKTTQPEKEVTTIIQTDEVVP